MTIYIATNVLVWALVALIVAHILKKAKPFEAGYAKYAKGVVLLLTGMAVSGGAAASILLNRVHELHITANL
tara:strand:+ start:1347 stop:1562 length:216 start_codon:yes stop_codon:yes gene_type:complete